MAARQKTLIAFSLLALAWVAAPQTHERQTRPVPARRIISLVPALTEILFDIGAGPHVIAVSSFDDYPAEVLKLPRVGALLDPDTERILSMRPDLVLVYESQEDLKKQLKQAGVATFDYRHAGLADVIPVFRALGDLTGRGAEAMARAHAIESRFAMIKGLVAGRPRPRTLLVMGREPESLRNLDASGGVGFLHDMVELAGGTNVFADIPRQAVRASTEMLLARAPEVILDLHYGSAANERQAAQERAVWQRLGALPAVKAARVHVLFGDYLVVPGPRIVQAAEAFARAIHPEAFR